MMQHLACELIGKRDIASAGLQDALAVLQPRTMPRP